jgi:hypothetical protein
VSATVRDALRTGGRVVISSALYDTRRGAQQALHFTASMGSASCNDIIAGSGRKWHSNMYGSSASIADSIAPCMA